MAFTVETKCCFVLITHYIYILNGWSEIPWAKTVGNWKERIKEINVFSPYHALDPQY